MLSSTAKEKDMKKFRIFYDKDAETKWLNQLSDQGYQLKSFKMGMYEFEERDPGKYLYMVDLIDRANFKMEEYAPPLEAVGIEVVAQFGNYAYIRKLKKNGPFRITKAVEDQIGQYNRIGLVFIAMMFVEYVAGLAEVIGGILTGKPLPLIIGLVLIVVGTAFLRIVIRIGQKVNYLDGRYDDQPEKKRKIESRM